MILLFTDFGCQGPYLGQMEIVLRQLAPNVDIVNLMCDAPPGKPRPSAYLLAAISSSLPVDSVCVCVVDPGVGGDRPAVVLKADEQWFVGPDNTLLNTLAKRAEQVQWWTIEWRPKKLSTSFHGRDLFAPVAAQLAKNSDMSGLRPYDGPDLSAWPGDLLEIIYIDHYGNAMTGLRYGASLKDKRLTINDHVVSEADTFCTVPVGQAFWYRNSNGLVEIAVNQGRADEHLRLGLGNEFYLQ